MSARKLLVVGSRSITSWGHDQLVRIAAQARLRGLRLVGLHFPETLATRSDEDALFDELVAADIDDPVSCADAVADRDDLAAVLTIRELSVEPVAAIARTLGLRGNDPAAVARIRNKDSCRDVLRAHGFPQPRTRRCEDARQALEFMRDTGDGPWIVKPRDGLASIGVSLVADADADALHAAIERIDDEQFLIETFVDGEELSAEGVMLNGQPTVLGLTRKIVGKGPGVVGLGFVETGHRQPASLEPPIAEHAREDVKQALSATGVLCGIFHVELWITDDGIVLGELHDRGGGDFIHLLVEQTRPGLSIFGLLIDDLLGRPAPPLPPPNGAAGATFPTFPSGIVTAIDGWDAIRNDDRVVACDLQLRVGDTLRPATGSYDRPAVFVVSGPTLEDVEATIAELEAQLIVTTS